MQAYWRPTVSRIFWKYHPSAINFIKSRFDQFGGIELSQRLAGTIAFLGSLTTEKQVETGGFIIKTGEGMGQTVALRVVNLTMGESREIILEPQEKLQPGEEYMGTLHCHPVTPVPSIHDVLSFVADPTEKIMIVHGVDGTINCLIKTEDTRTVDPAQVVALKPRYEKGDMATLVRDYNMAYYQGKLAKGQPAILPRAYVVGAGSKIVALDDLALAIKGSSTFPDASKKLPKKNTNPYGNVPEKKQVGHNCVLYK